MTIEILTLIFSFVAMLGSAITIFAFIGYICSKKRKAKFAELEKARVAKLKELEKELSRIDRLIENDTTPTVEVIKAVSAKKDLEQEIKMLSEKK